MPSTAPNSSKRSYDKKRINAAIDKLLKQAERIYAKRQGIVEPVFGHIKQTIGFAKFHLRGLEKVCGEFALVCLTHNLRKIVNALKELPAVNARHAVAIVAG